MTRSNLIVVGLAGRAGSGKNYVADHYFKPHGFLPVALADHFKATVAGRGLATYEEAFHTKPRQVRTLLQTEGTENGWMRWGPKVWPETLYTWMRHWERNWGFHKFVVTDVRFPHEITALHERGALVYGVQAPERAAAYAERLTDEQRNHSSERALIGMEHLFDGLIENDPDSPDVGRQLAALLAAHRVGA
jgi:hypothetical protein